MWQGVMSALAVTIFVGLLDRTAAAAVQVDIDCSDFRTAFSSKKSLLDIPDSPIKGSEHSICRLDKTCCTLEMETELRKQVHQDLATLLHHNSLSTYGQLVTSATSLQDHLTRLARWSENKTHNFFSQVYKRMSAMARDPIHQLYSDIVKYINTAWSPSESSSDASAWIDSPPVGLSMADSVSNFFAKLFPLALQSAVSPVPRDSLTGSHQRVLDPAYEKCLKESMKDVEPFGDAPRALSQSLSRAMEAARVLLGALRVGAHVLNSTDSFLVDGEPPSDQQCSDSLVRLWSCPRCAGLGRSVRPCAGYCLNVLRGCITSRAADLDQSWTAFVEAAARLAAFSSAAPAHPGRPQPAAKAARYQLNAEEAIRQMENKISEAVMYAMENGPAVERKVKRACGQPQWIQVDGSLQETSTAPWSSPASASASAAADVWAATDWAATPSPSSSSFVSLLHDLQSSLLQSREFYSNLAEVLCADEGFTETRESKSCWNGERVGEYTKTVAPASANAQKYNPELRWTERALDPRIVVLSEKLAHVRQTIVSQLSQAPESDSRVRSEEGSGSGQLEESDWSDDEDRNNVNWMEQGSGSGDYEINSGKTSGRRITEMDVINVESESKGSSASSLQSVNILQLYSILTVTLFIKRLLF